MSSGSGSRKVSLVVAFKLLLATENRRRRVNTPHLVALVRADVKFPNGQAEMFQSEKPDDDSFFWQTPSIFAASKATLPNT